MSRQLSGPYRHSRAAVAALMLMASFAAEGEEKQEAASAESPWSFSLTAYPTHVRDGESYTSAIALVDRGALHLEARYNYEAIGARSAFVGWSFSGGENVTWMIRPLLGGAWGEISAFVPAVEASVGWKKLDFYVEAEYVRDNKLEDDSYTYAWSELGYRPWSWLRGGVAGQHTRVYGGDRDAQFGPFLQVTWKKLTIGGYWFNPGSHEQVFVGSLGVAF
ncbi:MAG TPA: hypothetical protein VLC92_20180 [Rhodocyclaceae bacterium]|nr:hypothetical protein [Rhodocyclaceae bacterium]